MSTVEYREKGFAARESGADICLECDEEWDGSLLRHFDALPGCPNCAPWAEITTRVWAGEDLDDVLNDLAPDPTTVVDG